MKLIDADALKEAAVYSADLSTKQVDAIVDVLDAAPTVCCDNGKHSCAFYDPTGLKGFEDGCQLRTHPRLISARLLLCAVQGGPAMTPKPAESAVERAIYVIESAESEGRITYEEEMTVRAALAELKARPARGWGRITWVTTSVIGGARGQA